MARLLWGAVLEAMLSRWIGVQVCTPSWVGSKSGLHCWYSSIGWESKSGRTGIWASPGGVTGSALANSRAPADISVLAPVQAAVTWALVAVSPALLLCLYLIACGWAPQILPMNPARWVLSGSPGKPTAMLGCRIIYCQLSFFTGETLDWAGGRGFFSMWCCACRGERKWGQS